MKISSSAKKAIMIGSMCAISYLAVYVARNILGAATPQMIEGGSFTTESIGTLSSLFFICYAVGQLINGKIGDKIKAKYMISFGLALAGICNFVFPYLAKTPAAVFLAYGVSGFFLSMIYAPMTKVVAENTEPLHASRCGLGYTFSSLFGSPVAGILAAIFVWQSTFKVTGLILVTMGVICFVIFGIFEKIGLVQYGKYDKPKEKTEGSVKVLIKHKIIKFTLISVLTGVVRTTVVFWLPTYLSQYLSFSAEQAAMIFTVGTLVISFSAFLAAAIYELLKRKMEKTVLITFIMSATCFLAVLFINQPVFNIIFMVLAIMGANAASTMLWSYYCPSLRDTGMVSSATGFLDFMSYMAAAVSSTIFANAVAVIGWHGLIIVWAALMLVGVIISLPFDKFKKVK